MPHDDMEYMDLLSILPVEKRPLQALVMAHLNGMRTLPNNENVLQSG